MKNQILSLKVGIIVLFAGSSYAGNLYVDINSTNPAPPYSDWTTAATNIQDAVDAASAGDSIFVTNGVYASGQSVMYGQLTNRVTIDKAVTVQSVNGPAVTIIQGDSASVRCVYLTNGATLSGFTLTNGGTTNSVAGISGFGGGAWCETNGVEILSNCVVTGNEACTGAGGVYGGTLYNCTLSGNQTSTNGWGGGAGSCTLSNCTLIGNSAQLGGGAAYSTLAGCSLSGNTAVFGGGAAYSVLAACFVKTNSAVSTITGGLLVSNTIIFPGSGGGLYYGAATNSVIVGNSATNEGGGGYYSGFVNCTIVGNSAFEGGGMFEGGGINCIDYYNNGQNSFPYPNGAYCCTFPVTYPVPNTVSGSITNEPLFVDLAGGDFHLQSNSPCINSGKNSYVGVATDMDGNPRIQGGTVDMGAYEYQTPGSVLSYEWLEQYGLPLDGSVDFSDLDGTGMNDYQKWTAGLNPTNPASVFVMLTPGSWLCVTDRFYTLERATNLAAHPAFSVIKSGIPGADTGTNSYYDITAVGRGPYFYRVSVQR